MSAPNAKPRVRLNIRVSAEVGDQLIALAGRERRTQADIVEAALMSFLSPDSIDKRDAMVTRRLDRQARQIESFLGELIVATETLALFIRYFMSVTPALPEAQQGAARAKGAERFAAFSDSLARRLGEGKRLLGDLHVDIRPTVDEFRDADDVMGSARENGHAAE